MSRNLLADIQQLKPHTLIELFEFNAVALGDPNPFYWSSGNHPGGWDVVFGGIAYPAYPIEISGFDRQGRGSLPRPTLKVANVGGLIGSYVRSLRDALGAKVIRRRTLLKYLDAVNFPGGVNPDANPEARFPDEIFYVARKANENNVYLEMELAVRFDLDGVLIPRRLVLANTCQWVYRGAECTYSGGPVADIFDQPTNDPKKDQCAKTLTACRRRFPGTYGENAANRLPTSAFPSSLLGSLSG
jgi:lambda family phage minor tail protein L